MASPEDGTIAQGSAESGAPSSEGAGTTGAAEAPATAPEAAPDPYGDALDAYMGQRYAEALTKVDAALERSPETSARSKLERLRRRTTEKLAKEPAAQAQAPTPTPAPVADATPAVAEPAAPAPATPTEVPAPEPTAAPEPTTPAAEPAPEAPAAAEPAAVEPAAAEPSAAVAEPPAAPAEVAPPTAEAPTATGAQAAALLAATAAPSAPPAPVADPAKRPPAKRPSTSTPASTASPTATGSGRQAAVAPPKKAPAPAAVGRPSGAAPAPSPIALLRPELDKVTNELDRVNKSVGLVETHIVKVAEAYQKLAKDQKRKDQAYDQLYEELRQYKANFLAESQRPLLKDIILVFDGITRSLAGFQAGAEATVDRKAVVDALSHAKDELLEVLYRRDIERITERPAKLDVGFQKPVERLATDKPEEDRDVTQVLREGFRLNGVVLRPQEVVVKRHGNTTSTSTSSEEGGA